MSDIKLLVLDVDGVLTDGRLWYGAGPEPLRAFHIHDGLAIEWFRRLVGEVIILTAKESSAVRARAAELGIEHVIEGSTDKLKDLVRLLDTMGRELEQVAMVGDDLPDLPILSRCGFPIAPANAVGELKAAARFVTTRSGGRGAVREAIEHLLRRAERWTEVVEHYRGVVTPQPTGSGDVA